MPTAAEKMHGLKTSGDSCTIHFEFFIETVLARGKKPEHDVAGSSHAIYGALVWLFHFELAKWGILGRCAAN